MVSKSKGPVDDGLTQAVGSASSTTKTLKAGRAKKGKKGDQVSAWISLAGIVFEGAVLVAVILLRLSGLLGHISAWVTWTAFRLQTPCRA